MIDGKGRTPMIEQPRTRLVRASGAALTRGVDIQKIEGVPVRITAPTKTVVDFFKYRGRVGTDVAVDGLRAC